MLNIHLLFQEVFKFWCIIFMIMFVGLYNSISDCFTRPNTHFTARSYTEGSIAMANCLSVRLLRWSTVVTKIGILRKYFHSRLA